MEHNRDTNTEVTTYRYLRSCLLALLLALTVSVVVETVRGGWQTSISAYYYTPAGPVFIGVLSSVGVCLVALHGYTDAENVCLNLAGISAPMVAFVPTPEQGRTPDVAAITNNATTYLAVLGVGYLVVLGYAWRRLRRHEPLSVWSVIGLVSVGLAWLIGAVWLAADRAAFAAHAHMLAAAFTFLPFAGVVALNTDWGVRVLARRAGPSRTRFDRAYWVVLIGMGCAAVGFAVVRASWDYAMLGVEIALLALFAAFWILQTIDLMDPARDLRTSAAAAPERSTLVLGDRWTRLLP
ncbi:hypothetical protein [Flexivirga oryzae]|uniref:DUF998 domain-containing protein n=1 Tax=Flexivirga oryzae TaxID=1794944 RepID=A0A839NGJ9_9MICO|nr:hypothetical protein [Flexivirga oryzae]MBB2894726.1 hypothetical protein [Flexivirga oryzae]